MNNPSKILAIIPARGGSKGVPRKNIVSIYGKPLIAWTIEAALSSGVIGRLVVSTEDLEIAKIARQYGAEVLDRPSELAEDTALTEPVMEHVLATLEKNGYSPDYIALIQCTSPLLQSKHILEAVDKVVSDVYDSCFTCFYPDGYEFKWSRNERGNMVPEHDVENRPRRQDINLPFHENGAFYITKTNFFKKTKNRFGGMGARIAGVVMSEADSIQIDSFYHLAVAEALLRQRM